MKSPKISGHRTSKRQQEVIRDLDTHHTNAVSLGTELGLCEM